MSTWRSKASDLFRTWQRARDRTKQAKQARLEKREADELDRARAGADRFPPMRG
jgi:hypothetical protein